MARALTAGTTLPEPEGSTAAMHARLRRVAGQALTLRAALTTTLGPQRPVSRGFVEWATSVRYPRALSEEQPWSSSAEALASPAESPAHAADRSRAPNGWTPRRQLTLSGKRPLRIASSTGTSPVPRGSLLRRPFTRVDPPSRHGSTSRSAA